MVFLLVVVFGFPFYGVISCYGDPPAKAGHVYYWLLGGFGQAGCFVWRRIFCVLSWYGMCNAKGHQKLIDGHGGADMGFWVGRDMNTQSPILHFKMR